jgi:hypothetical protein
LASNCIVQYVVDVMHTHGMNTVDQHVIALVSYDWSEVSPSLAAGALQATQLWTMVTGTGPTTVMAAKHRSTRLYTWTVPSKFNFMAALLCQFQFMHLAPDWAMLHWTHAICVLCHAAMYCGGCHVGQCHTTYSLHDIMGSQHRQSEHFAVPQFG